MMMSDQQSARSAARHDAILEALCRRMIPSAFTDGSLDGSRDVINAMNERIATLPLRQQRDIATALRIFAHPLAAILHLHKPAQFENLDADAQDRRMREWEQSRVPFCRTIFQAFRRIIMSTYYAQPHVQQRIGYAGPLRGRAPVVEWEGPVDGAGNGVIAGATSPRQITDMPARPPASGVSRCNVLVIGSGAGGAVAAARLAEAGESVVVLEEGAWYSTAEFTDNEREMMPRLFADAAARATDDVSISLLQGRCAGGGTTVNWMLMLRPREFVLHEWEHEHHAEILTATTLLPEIERIERELGAGFIPGDAHNPPNRIILDGARALGWRAEEARINAQGCIRAGTCSLGCSHGAKRSAGAVFLPRAVAAGAKIFCNARAHRIGSHSGAWRVTIASRDPEIPREIVADRVVVAAGAVGTPVLLQRSGLGNHNVGAWLRLHPTTAVQGLYDRVMYGAAGVPQSALLSEFMDTNGGFGFWIECPPLLPSLAAVAVGGFGDAHRDVMQSFPSLASLIVLTRDGSVRTHSSGHIRARRHGVSIRYTPHANDAVSIRDGIAAAARLHLAAGARSAMTLHTPSIRIDAISDIEQVARTSMAPNRLGLFSAHVNGTARMGGNRCTHACAPNGQLFGHRGVFVADGSLFPSAPGVNPQASIMAMASLIADRM